MNLQSKALLVQLSVSQWTARKMDKRVTQDIIAQHHADAKSGNFHKSLLAGTDLLSNIHDKTTDIRKYVYNNTLPWAVNGTALLKSSAYLGFMTDFRKMKNDWEYLVDRFCTEYPTLKQAAKSRLNTMYREADYPDDHRIRAKFNIDLGIYPVPNDDFRVSIGDAELAQLQADVEARVQSASQTAMQEAWKRLYERVEHISNKLSDPKAIFRDSMIENAKEICNILPRLNFTDDPNLETMRQEVEKKLAGHHPDALRNNPTLRESTADEAKKIMGAMAAFMG